MLALFEMTRATGKRDGAKSGIVCVCTCTSMFYLRKQAVRLKDSSRGGGGMSKQRLGWQVRMDDCA